MGNGCTNGMNGCYDQFVFLPPTTPSYSMTYPRKCTLITTKSNLKIPSYFIPSKKSKTKLTLLYSHGNAADIGLMSCFLSLLHNRLDVNILHYDYVGYGLSKKEGMKANEMMTYESIMAAMKFLELEKNIMQNDVIGFGSSIGSGPTLYMASKYEKLRGIILECPFTTTLRVVFNHVPKIILHPFDMFKNYRKIRKINSPLLIIHGEDDNLVPISHSEEIWKTIKNERLKYKFVRVKDANHHNIMEKMTARLYIKELNDFIQFLRKNDNNDNNDNIIEEKDSQLIERIK